MTWPFHDSESLLPLTRVLQREGTGMLWNHNQIKIQDKCGGFITVAAQALTDRSIPYQSLKQISPEKVSALGTDIKHFSQISGITLRNKSKPLAVIFKTLKEKKM